MTDYISRVGEGTYQIVFTTQDKAEYEHIQDEIRNLIDKKEAINFANAHSESIQGIRQELDRIKSNGEKTAAWRLRSIPDDEGSIIHGLECSNCERFFESKTRYCPECGAKMTNAE